MRVHFPTRITGQRGTLAVLEIEFTSKARRVVVRGFDGLEPLDLKGEKPGGTYDVPDTLPRLHVPVRVTKDGAGKARLEVRVDDARGSVAPETWQATVTLDAPAAAAARGQKGWLLGAFAAVVGAIAVFVLLPMFQATKVPKLQGRGVEDAQKIIRSQGYVPQVRRRPTDVPAEVGVVLEQSPAAGKELPRESAVEIVVGTAREVASDVPDVVGKPVEEAREALKAARFKTSEKEEDAAEDKAGRVLSMQPVAGTRVTEGTEIALVVGRRAAATPTPPTPPEPTPPVPPVPSIPPVPGVADVALPDVLGKTADEAKKALETAGFTVETTPAEGSPGDAGKVIAQSPPAGTAHKGAVITLTVVPPAGTPAVPPVPPTPPVPPPTPPVPPTPPPTPPTTAHVAPDVLGLERAKAEAEVAKAGFTHKVTYEDTTDESDLVDVVLKQKPAAGDPLPANGAVELVVSRRAAPKGVSVPAVVGKTEVEARRLLAQFDVKVSYVDATAEKDGVVQTQDPAGGTLANPKSTANLTVGRFVPPVQPPPTPPTPPPPTPPEPTPPTPPPPVPPEPTPPTPPPTPPTPPEPTPPPPPPTPPTPPPTPPTPPEPTPPTPPPTPPEPTPPTPPPTPPPPPPYVPPTPPPYVPPPTPPSVVRPSDSSLPPPIHLSPGQSLPPPMRVAGASPAPRPVESGTRPLPAPRPNPTPGPYTGPSTGQTGPTYVPSTAAPAPRVSIPGAGTPSTVPALEGVSGFDAVDRLVAAGFRANVVPDRDPRATAGRVRTQTPRSGSTAARGDVVTITVGAGFSPYAVEIPDVVGQRLADATSRLASAGSTASVMRVPGVAHDVVVAQYPVGRFVREQARTVTIWVGQ